MTTWTLLFPSEKNFFNPVAINFAGWCSGYGGNNFNTAGESIVFQNFH